MLRSVRWRRGLTQADLARRAGTSQPVVSAYEHGRRDPTVGTLARLVDAAGEQLRIGADLSAGGPAPREASRSTRVASWTCSSSPTRSRQRRGHTCCARPARVGATMLTLPERIVAIEDALPRIPHAFGGALALAYYAEPRATIDIDLNVFVSVARYADVAGPLAALGVGADEPEAAAAAARDGQTRVMWDETPIDLFFAYDAFHDAAAAARRRVPFAASMIAILAPEHLVVCKVVFNRPKDWVDIDAMIEADVALDAAEVLRWVGRIAGDTDPRYTRVAAVLTRR